MRACMRAGNCKRRGALRWHRSQSAVWLQVIRDIDIGNVVSTLTGAQRRWTLLEYCAVAGNGADSNSVPVRKTPPEVRAPCAVAPTCSCSQLLVFYGSECSQNHHAMPALHVHRVSNEAAHCDLRVCTRLATLRMHACMLGRVM